MSDDNTLTRFTGAGAARRAGISVSRATVEKTDDGKLLQEADLSGYNGETRRGAERFQQYGLATRPKAPTGKKKAEAIVVYPNGNRSNAVVIAIDDRRFRLKNLKEGEVALYDDQGQKVHLTRDGIKFDAGSSKKPMTFTCGSSSITIADGKVTITADNIYCVGDTAIGVDGEDKPVKVLTVAGPAAKAYSKV